MDSTSAGTTTSTVGSTSTGSTDTGSGASSGSGSSGAGSTDGRTGDPSRMGAPATAGTTNTDGGSTDPRESSPDGRTSTELRQRPDDVSTTAGGASTVAGDETIQSPTDTGAANDPNSSHPAGGPDADEGGEGTYAELMTGKAPESK